MANRYSGLVKMPRYVSYRYPAICTSVTATRRMWVRVIGLIAGILFRTGWSA